MAKFGQVFKNVNTEKHSHPDRITEWIHYTKLISSKYQYCDAKTKEELLKLADVIQADGEVIQNLYIRKYGTDTFEIIAGHKRRMATQILVEERGLEEYAFLPCTVSDKSEIQTRFSVISTNTYHQKTAYEIMHEIEEMAYLLKNYPEQFGGKESSGRMVERLAKQLSMSRSVVSDYQNISHNLGETAMNAFKNNEITKSAATELAGLPVEEQEALIQQNKTNFTEIKKYKKEKNASESNITVKKNESSFSQVTHEQNPEKWQRTLSETDTTDKGEADKKNKTIEENKILPKEKDNQENIQKETPDQMRSNNVALEEKKLGQEHIKQDTDASGVRKMIDENDYLSWEIWTQNTVIEEVLYRQTLKDGIIAVVRSYPRYFEETQEEYIDATYYLLPPGYKHFADCQVDLNIFWDYVRDNTR